MWCAGCRKAPDALSKNPGPYGTRLTKLQQSLRVCPSRAERYERVETTETVICETQNFIGGSGLEAAGFWPDAR